MLSDETKLAVAAAYAEATRRGDVDAIAALSEPDATVWHAYDDAVVTLEQSARTLRWLHGRVDDLDWVDVATTPTAHGFVWQAIIVGTAPGGSLRVHTCAVVSLSAAGRVARTEEYLDAAGLAVLARRGEHQEGSERPRATPARRS
jgi:ketosteroid isomerase-like protein